MSTKWKTGTLFAAAYLLFGGLSTYAHVNWFVEHDISKPPLAIGEVINRTFVTLFLVFAAACYLFFLADRWIFKKGILSGFDQRLKRFEAVASLIMRVSSGIFFLSLFIWYQVHGSTFYITPEIETNAAWVAWLHLHLLMAVAVIFRPTVLLTGIGVLILYGAAIAVEPEIETASKVVGTTDGNRRVIDRPISKLSRF